MNIRRIASVGSALVVAAIAAYASYSHMRHLALEYGQDRTVATLLPVSVDGLMVVATIALGDGRRHRWSAWLAFWAGVAASVIANVLAAQPSGVARTISAWPAIAFLLVVEVITRGGRFRQVADVGSPKLGEPADTTPPTKPTPTRTAKRTEPRPAGRPSAAAKVAAVAAKMPGAKPAEIAARAGVSTKTVKRHLTDTTRAVEVDKTPATSADMTPVNGTPVPELITTD